MMNIDHLFIVATRSIANKVLKNTLEYIIAFDKKTGTIQPVRKNEIIKLLKSESKLFEIKKVDNIITNPPFKLAMDFVYKANELCKYKFVFLCRINFLEGVARGKMFEEMPLKNVYIFKFI